MDAIRLMGRMVQLRKLSHSNVGCVILTICPMLHLLMEVRMREFPCNNVGHVILTISPIFPCPTTILLPRMALHLQHLTAQGLSPMMANRRTRKSPLALLLSSAARVFLLKLYFLCRFTGCKFETNSNGRSCTASIG